jgi:hypothetical protein
MYRIEKDSENKKYISFVICTSVSFSLSRWIYCGSVNSGSSLMELTTEK